LKIALLIPTLQVGGSERNIVLLGEVLAAKGAEVQVWLTSADQRELPTALRVVPTCPVGGGGRALAILRRVSGIRAQLTRFRPDCMISFLESSNIPALLAGMLTGTPTIVSVRGNPHRFNWFYRVMAFLFYRHARSVVLPSREVADYLAKNYLLRNTVCIPNIQLSANGAAIVSPRKVDGPMLAVGRLVPGKRFDDVIALAESIAAQRELVIVGDGPLRAALEARAAGSSVKVSFAGALPHAQVLSMLEHSSVLLSMSESECWPNAIAEALSIGTPVIARDCDYGPREMIVDGRNGFLIRSAQEVRQRPEVASALASETRYAQMCRDAAQGALAWHRERISALWFDAVAGARR
jgi:glycosyltransferase involved in cell wall biosynthesis